MTLEKPVFIWGAGKSGTHLLYDLLSLHPSLACFKVSGRRNKGLWGDLHWGDSTPEQLKGKPVPQEGGVHFWGQAGVPYFKVSSGEVETIGLLGRQDLSKSSIRAVRERYADLRD